MDIFDDLPCSRRVVEDVIVFSKTYDEHILAVRDLFTRAANHNIALNCDKLVFAESSVKFGGYIVDSTGFRPNPDVTQAIQQFLSPENITDLRAFFGLCQQVGNFSNHIALELQPLAPLLKKGLSRNGQPPTTTGSAVLELPYPTLLISRFMIQLA